MSGADACGGSTPWLKEARCQVLWRYYRPPSLLPFSWRGCQSLSLNRPVMWLLRDLLWYPTVIDASHKSICIDQHADSSVQQRAIESWQNSAVRIDRLCSSQWKTAGFLRKHCGYKATCTASMICLARTSKQKIKFAEINNWRSHWQYNRWTSHKRGINTQNESTRRGCKTRTAKGRMKLQ